MRQCVRSQKPFKILGKLKVMLFLFYHPFYNISLEFSKKCAEKITVNLIENTD